MSNDRDARKVYDVSLALHQGETIEAESLDDAMEQAKNMEVSGGDLTYIHVEDRQTGAEKEWGR